MHLTEACPEEIEAGGRGIAARARRLPEGRYSSFSIVIGVLRMRFPVAWKTALAMAALTLAVEGAARTMSNHLATRAGVATDTKIVKAQIVTFPRFSSSHNESSLVI